jgi:hypothetical protein
MSMRFRIICNIKEVLPIFKFKKKCNHVWAEISTKFYYNWDGYKILKVTYKCTCEGCKKNKIKKLW